MSCKHQFPFGAGIRPDISKVREEHFGQCFQAFYVPSSHIPIKNNIIYIRESTLTPSSIQDAYKNYIWAHDFQNGGNAGIALERPFPVKTILHSQLNSRRVAAADGA